MPSPKTITPEEHARQIQLFTAERPHYVAFATALKKAMEKACGVSLPEAFVQSRAKTVSSFAEKCVRKHGRYPDAVNQLTDLCGARVIVQTLAQVEAVKSFVEANFVIHERDEKGTTLGEDKFGYRDMHYIVALKADRAPALGFTPSEIAEIGDRRAELQVRTWVQHAWADTLHDRIYKNPLKVSPGIKRAGNLLAALMEEADRNFEGMAGELDGMIANYSAHASRGEVQAEIEVQRLILANEPQAGKKAGLSLKLARLLSACGEHAAVVGLLEPHQGLADANQPELLQELGFAQVSLSRGQPASDGYRRGVGHLEQAVALCAAGELNHVPSLRKRESLRARALARLAGALESMPRAEQRASAVWHEAHDHEPSNPYILSGMLGFDVFLSRQLDRAIPMATVVRQAVQTCKHHAASGIELPQAWFTAGRLSLLLGRTEDAIGLYARGIRHCLDGAHCLPPDTLAAEEDWISRLFAAKDLPPAFQWVLDLFELARQAQPGPAVAGTAARGLILAGGATSLDAAAVARIRPLVRVALASFPGPVVSGGTTVGVPGCAGEIAAELAGQNAKHFTLTGFLPRNLPGDAPRDLRYDKLTECGEIGFTPEQIFGYWRAFLAAGLKPREIFCLGFGGGRVSRMEYQIALALGATVGVVSLRDADAAHAMANDPLWKNPGNLFPLPPDPATLRALLIPAAPDFPPAILEGMGKAFHQQYVKDSASKLPDPMKPWPDLKDTYKNANLGQAAYAVRILKAAGFEVRPAEKPVIFTGFTDPEIERMAELEHGRWNAERLRDGWRPGKARDDANKIHPCLVEWTELSDGPNGVKKYDRNGVKAFPAILAGAGLEVFRPANPPNPA